MFDWFDEPLVNYRRLAPMRSGVFDYMSRWMDSVDKAMEKEFGDFYDNFNQQPENEKGDKKDEKKGDKKEGHDEEPQYYSFSSSMYSGSDGVQHIFREEHDSKTGKSKTVETRRIGDKSMTLHRVTDKDGHVEEHETRKNIKDDEVEQFKKDWVAHNVPDVAKLPEPKDKPKAVKHEK